MTLMAATRRLTAAQMCRASDGLFECVPPYSELLSLLPRLGLSF